MSRRSRLLTAILHCCSGKFACCKWIISCLHEFNNVAACNDQSSIRERAHQRRMSTQIRWVSVVWYQKLKLCLCLLRPQLISENVLFLYIWVCCQTAYTDYRHIKHGQRGTILASICHLQLLVLCMRGFPFQLMKSCSYLKAAKKVCALHLQPIIWRMLRIFKAAHTPHPWKNLAELAPKLINTCCTFGTVCICAETLHLLIKHISFLMGEFWALFSITKCQCVVGAHCC